MNLIFRMVAVEFIYTVHVCMQNTTPLCTTCLLQKHLSVQTEPDFGRTFLENSLANAEIIQKYVIKNIR